jgi:hypothetical protein
MLKAILEIAIFSDITHIFKVDDWDTRIESDIHEKVKDIIISDYCGQRLNTGVGPRAYHCNKCPLDSKWRNKKYEGLYVPWLDGGCGYILSRNAMKIICNTEMSESEIYDNFIYEDLMIALILNKNDIHPKRIKQIIKGDK